MTQDEVDTIYNYLHENFRYEDGLFIRKKDGEIIYGRIDSRAKKLLFMLDVKFNKKRYKWSYAHFIYFYHHKIKPKYLININGNAADIRIENLKEATHSEMMIESDIKVKNKHGYKGVFLDGKRYAARLWLGTKYKYVSWHNTAKEAHEAYLKAKMESANK
jgi:hypothetical protein